MEIQHKIRALRKKQNLSQDRFGVKLGLSGKTVSAYETGKIDPPLKVLEKISRVYNTDIIGLDDKRKNTIKTKLEEIENRISDLRYLIEE